MCNTTREGLRDYNKFYITCISRGNFFATMYKQEFASKREERKRERKHTRKVAPILESPQKSHGSAIRETFVVTHCGWLPSSNEEERSRRETRTCRKMNTRLYKRVLLSSWDSGKLNRRRNIKEKRMCAGNTRDECNQGWQVATVTLT